MESDYESDSESDEIASEAESERKSDDDSEEKAAAEVVMRSQSEINKANRTFLEKYIDENNIKKKTVWTSNRVAALEGAAIEHNPGGYSTEQLIQQIKVLLKERARRKVRLASHAENATTIGMSADSNKSGMHIDAAPVVFGSSDPSASPAISEPLPVSVPMLVPLVDVDTMGVTITPPVVDADVSSTPSHVLASVANVFASTRSELRVTPVSG